MCNASQSVGSPTLQPAGTCTVSDSISEQVHVQHVFNPSNLDKYNLEVTYKHFL